MKQLPQYFIVNRVEDNPLWDEYIKWLNETYKIDWNGNAFTYYGYDGSTNSGENGTDGWNEIYEFKNNPTIITLEEWDECINNKNKNEMEQTLTREQLKQIYDVACSSWKSKINNLVKRIDQYSNTLNLTDEFVKEMFTAANGDQKEVLLAVGLKRITESPIQKALRLAGVPKFESAKVSVLYDNLIAISLPSSNTKWSFAVFEWVMEFCKQNPNSYPHHNFELCADKGNEFMFIKYIP